MTCSQTLLKNCGRFAAILTGLIWFASLTGAAVPAPVDLRCDWGVDPDGVDSPAPRLSWRLPPSEDATHRTLWIAAWQVRAASSAAGLDGEQAGLWDSGKVATPDAFSALYSGRSLRSGEQVFWKVRVWDAAGDVSPWSATASLTTGLLTAADWGGARWITDPELLRWRRERIGSRSAFVSDVNTLKWIQLDLGETKVIETVRLHAIQHTVDERFGWPIRFKIEAANDPDFAHPAVIADHTRSDYPKESARDAGFAAPPGLSARYVRVTATRLRAFEGRACLAFSQIEVRSGGKNLAPAAKVSSSDGVADALWSDPSVVDGLDAPGANPHENATRRLRREFIVRPGLTRALLFVSGLGHCATTVNGESVGSGVLTPGWTNYARTCLYETLDVTRSLQPGANALGLELAGGMYNVRPGRYVKFISAFRPLTAVVKLTLEYRDGSSETLDSDITWRIAPGPTTFSNVFGGEDYDARLETPGWNRAGFDASGWSPAVAWPGPGGELRGYSHASPAFALRETPPPVATRTHAPHLSVIDLGENRSRQLSLAVKGPRGARVKIVPAELLRADGRVDRESAAHGSVESSWNYTLRGDVGGESWTPPFFYHGCRFLQIELSAPEGQPLPVVEKIAAPLVFSDSRDAGDFSCSSELFNRIRSLIRGAQQSNLAHVLTDCPHRERLGWLEQYHLHGLALRYEWDLNRLFAKTFRDMADAQTPAGLIPDIAPEYVVFGGGFRDSPEWGSTFIIAPWQHFVWTGDDAPLRAHYDGMVRYLDYLGTKATGQLLNHGLGDWYDLGPKQPGPAQLTPVGLTATAYYYQNAALLALIAEKLGRPADVARFRALAGSIKTAFNQEYFDTAAGRYAEGSQTAQAMPLVLGLAPEEQRKAVFVALLQDLERRSYAVTAGDIGHRYLLRALADEGRSDLVARIHSQTDRPGYGYILAQGATALTEAWTAERRSSQNHFMLGHLTEWFFHDLAGIQPDPDGPGFARVILAPQPVPGIDWAKASVATPRGLVSVHWFIRDGTFTVEARVPAGSVATVKLPGAAGKVVLENGRPLAAAPGVRRRLSKGPDVELEIGGGHYLFSFPTNPP